MTVPVFISYHGTDVAIAREMRNSLLRLSESFSVFLDRDSIAPSENYEVRIAEEIKRAEWFLIVCTGFPRPDADMMWSFFEAGQFRATLKESLIREANKRIVCAFDDEPPSILAKFQGVKVCAKQRSGNPIDMALPPRSNVQLDDSAIFDLLQRMVANAPDAPLRDTSAVNTREMLREEAHKLIKLFEAAGPETKIKEKSLQPRISFELEPNQGLSPGTIVKGYDASLRLLFAIESEETTWADIVKVCCRPGGGTPAWLSDIEKASTEIMQDRMPDNAAKKCILRSVIYRVYTARYEVFKDRRRVIYVGFLPVMSQPFDLTRRSSTLLSALILSVRFREQLIPMAAPLRTNPSAKLLRDFYRLLLAIEMESRQFGLVIESTIPGEESPVSAVFTDAKKRKKIQEMIDDWVPDRATIEKFFVDAPVNLDLPNEVKKCAGEIADILNKITDVNATFIDMISEELLVQVKSHKRRSVGRKEHSRRRRSSKSVAKKSMKGRVGKQGAAI